MQIFLKFKKKILFHFCVFICAKKYDKWHKMKKEYTLLIQHFCFILVTNIQSSGLSTVIKININFFLFLSCDYFEFRILIKFVKRHSNFYFRLKLFRLIFMHTYSKCYSFCRSSSIFCMSWKNWKRFSWNLRGIFNSLASNFNFDWNANILSTGMKNPTICFKFRYG